MSNQKQHNDFEALSAGYLLGALSKKENAEFEKRLKNASEEELCIFNELRETRDEVALAVDAAEPSDDLFVGVLKRISGTPEKQASVLPMWAYKAAAALFLVGFLTLAIIMQQLYGTVDEQETLISDQMTTIIDNMETITRLETELEQRNELLAILGSREVNFVVMAGQDVSPDGYGKVNWDTGNQRALLQLANLPAPPEDKIISSG